MKSWKDDNMLLNENKASYMIKHALGSGFTSERVYAIRLKDGRYVKNYEDNDGSRDKIVCDLLNSAREKKYSDMRNLIENHYDEITTDSLDDAMTFWFVGTSKDSSQYAVKKLMDGKFVELEVHCDDAYYEETNDDFHHWNDR